jgi:hypothetical protein
MRIGKNRKQWLMSHPPAEEGSKSWRNDGDWEREKSKPEFPVIREKGSSLILLQV